MEQVDLKALRAASDAAQMSDEVRAAFHVLAKIACEVAVGRSLAGCHTVRSAAYQGAVSDARQAITLATAALSGGKAI